jgi:hypothetical protein
MEMDGSWGADTLDTLAWYITSDRANETLTLLQLVRTGAGPRLGCLYAEK